MNNNPPDIVFTWAGINHLLDCNKCSFNFFMWIDKNVCSCHVVPRLSQHL